ncbi:MAG: site-2 protease family protein [Chloroflexota bacterium]|nr:site-2 protease family protein [Chloroflexota bacterium]MDE2896701.1 site-2 protease family protein [Chloroflexota bacterium]
MGGTDFNIDATWLIMFAFVTWTTATSVIPVRLIDSSLQEGVRLDATWPAVWVGGVVTSLLFFTCIVAHEAAHTVVAVRTGIPVRSIRLFIFGGLAEMGREPDRPSQEFFITVVGPLTSAALGGLFLALGDQLEAASIPAVTARWLGEMNLALAVFNMLPGFPLDGGRILRSIMWAVTGDVVRATRVASFVGSALGAALMAFGLIQFLLLGGALHSLWISVIGWFLWSAARGGYRDAILRQQLHRYRIRDLLRPESGAVPSDGTVQEFIERGLYHDRFGLRPVVDAAGKLIGMLEGDDVRDVPLEQRVETQLREIARPVDEMAVVAPDDLLSVVIDKAYETDRRLYFVVEDGYVLGIVDTVDVVNTLRARNR